jgi:hypothetical protein
VIRREREGYIEGRRDREMEGEKDIEGEKEKLRYRARKT